MPTGTSTSNRTSAATSTPPGPSFHTQMKCKICRLPQKALRAKAGSGKVLRVEAATTVLTVSYEGVIRNNGKNSEVAVNAEGSANM